MSKHSAKELEAVVSKMVTDFVAKAERQREAMSTVVGEVMRRAREITESHAEVVAPLLSQAGLWLPPSQATALVGKLKKLADQGKTEPEAVWQVVVGHFEEGEWSALRRMVSSWDDNPYFSNRMSILCDALEAHIEGTYSLVVPTLLAQIEGVLSSILRVPAGDTTRIVKTAVGELGNDYLAAVCKDILVAFITSPAGYGGVKDDYFTPERFPEWLESKGIVEEQALNRHAILHGVQVNYASTENSLRVFFLLDALYWMRVEEWHELLRCTPSLPS